MDEEYLKEEDLNEFDKKILQQIGDAHSQNKTFTNSTPLEVAKEVFGFKGFKENGQKEIIDFILQKKGNVLGIMPTGGGKSACFQIPALIQDNMTLIVSPLIALMKDQVESLLKKGINSTFFINSSIHEDIKEKIITLISSNKVKMLYVAPESLQSNRIQSVLSKVKIDLIVIDEAHCISTWGHNFRPDYLKLADIIGNLGSPPVLALTATATKKTIEDIQIQLRRRFEVFKASFDRPLLYLVVQNVPDNIDKEQFLLNLIRRLEGPIVVFTRSRTLSETLSEFLNKNGFKSMYYHAGLSSEERQKRQNSFMSGECNIIVATIAFGMGIDKKDIRNVIHYNIPQSVEGYYQEIGRAGRDGDKSNCILLFTQGDIHRIKALISADWPTHEKIRDLISYLKKMNTNIVFAHPKGLVYETNIKEIPIKLILYQLEESGAITKYSNVLHNFKIKFNKEFDLIEKSFDINYTAELKNILNSKHVKGKKKNIDLEQLSNETKIPYFRLRELFTLMARDNYISMTSEHYKDMIIIRKELDSFDIMPLVNQFKDILNENYKKVDELVECLASKKCVRHNILKYFDEPQLKPTCEMCSNCVNNDLVSLIPMEINENYASDEEIKQLLSEKIDIRLDELHITLLKCIGIDQHIPEKDLYKIMIGKLHNFSAKWKSDLISYGLLPDLKESELNDTLNKLISDYLVQITSDGDLRITKKGIDLVYKISNTTLLEPNPIKTKNISKLIIAGKLDDKTEETLSKLLQNNTEGELRSKLNKQLNNAFFVETIYGLNNNKCSRCGADGNGYYQNKFGQSSKVILTIHHKKSDWECPYKNKTEYHCKICSERNTEMFNPCVKNCILLCGLCHYKLHHSL